MVILYNFFLLILITASGQLIASLVMKKMNKSEAATNLFAYAISSLLSFLLSLIHQPATAQFLEIIAISFLAVMVVEPFYMKLRRKNSHTGRDQYMYTIDEYINTMKRNLEKENDGVTENLQALFQRTFADGIELLDFTIFIEPTRFECSVSVFSMDRHANEVLSDSAGTGRFYGSQEIAADIAYFELPDSRRAKFEEFYMKNEEELMSLELKVLTDWFQQNWEKAGGRSLMLPSYLVLHDGYSSYDLKQKRWVGDEEKWR